MSFVRQLRKNEKFLDELCLAAPKKNEKFLNELCLAAPKKIKILRWALSGSSENIKKI